MMMVKTVLKEYNVFLSTTIKCKKNEEKECTNPNISSANDVEL